MNRIFECSGIPQILEPRQEIVAKHLTIDMVETVMKQSTHAIFPVSGDCMERAGVVDRGWVAVDFTRFPALPRYRSEGGNGSADLSVHVLCGLPRPASPCCHGESVYRRIRSMADGGDPLRHVEG